MGNFLAYFRARVLLGNMSKKGNDYTVIPRIAKQRNMYRSQLLHDNIHTVFKNTQIALKLKMSSSTTFTLCDLSRNCVIFQDQILTMFSIL